MIDFWTPGDYATVKYSPEGEELWVARCDGPASADDRAWSLAFDSQGNVYVTDGSSDDYATLKYSPEGEELWVARYDGPPGADDLAFRLAVDSEGHAYVTGDSEGSDTPDDFATVKYSPEGEELWVARYDGPPGAWDGFRWIAVDSEGHVYVAAWSEGPSTGLDYATIKYSQELLSEIRPSDCNADGAVDISDSTALLGHLFLGGFGELPCGDGTLQHSGNLRLLDANGDEAVDLSDGIYVLGFLFLGSPAPVAPFPSCGLELLDADEALGCETAPANCP